MRQNCPNCNSQAFKRNGYTRHGKQNHRCLECGRQFSLEPDAPIPDSVAETAEGYFVDAPIASRKMNH